MLNMSQNLSFVNNYAINSVIYDNNEEINNKKYNMM